MKEYLIVHSGGVLFGIILIIVGIKYKLLEYIIPGCLWFIANAIFLTRGEKAFDSIMNYNSPYFSILFMAIPAFIMGLFVIKGTYINNNQLIRLLVFIVIIVDSIHLWNTNRVILIAIIFILIVIRQIRKRHYDDIHQLIPLQRTYIGLSDILFIVPKYKNVPITDDPKFVEEIKKISKGKILGMHGVTHTPEGYFRNAEFGFPRTKEYIMEGVNIFEKAFGYKPTIFKAPCYNLLNENKKIIEELGMKVSGVETLLFNKLYHPDYDYFMKTCNTLNIIL